jgi:quercetin dioxygenase-like cupin family protein
MSRLIDLADMPPLEMRPGSVIARRMEGQRITMAVFELQPGAVVPEHEHPAEQIGLCIRGSITFTIGDETRTLGPGGTWYVPSGVPHRAEAGPAGAVAGEAC